MAYRHLRTLLAVLAVPALLVAACGDPQPTPDEPDDPGVDEPQPDDAPEDPEPGEAEPEPDDGRTALEDELRRFERHAVQLAVDEHDVDASAITVVEVEAVTWPDGALGCPQEGEMYTQALVDGYRGVLDVDGEQVHYHAAEADSPFRCDDPQPPVERR